MYLYLKTINNFTITKRTNFSREKYEDNNGNKITKEDFCSYTNINAKYIDNILMNNFSAYTLKNTRNMYFGKMNVVDTDEDIKNSIKLIKEINLLDNDDLILEFEDFKDYVNLEKIILPNLSKISPRCFQNCVRLYDIALPNTLEIICDEAFDKCKSLNFINLPESLKKIEKYAFSECISLYSITIPKNVTQIGYFAFQHCKSLINVKCPDALNCLNDDYINDDAFRGCERLKKINLPEGMTKIKANTFIDCFNLEKINFPDSLVEIGSEAFNACEKLNKIKFGKNLKKLNNGAFANCRKIKEIKFPDGLETIGSYAFSYCDILNEIEFPKSLNEIGKAAFYLTAWTDKHNDLLIVNNILIDVKTNEKTINIPSNITTINHHAFGNCNKIENINIPNSVRKIKSEAFDDCINLKTINLPESISEIDMSAFYKCEKLEEINVSINNKDFTSIDGVLYSKNKKILYYYPNAKKNYNFTIPKDVITIDKYAFKENDKLIDIKLNENLEEIKEGAFIKCKNLSNITLPSNIKYIGLNALSGDMSYITYKAIDYKDEESLEKILNDNGVKIDGPFFRKIDLFSSLRKK